MNEYLLGNLMYGHAGNADSWTLPAVIQQQLRLTEEFFASGAGNKLCIVMPARERAAQWLSLPLALNVIKEDYEKYSGEIYQSYQRYQRGEKLILNNDAVVAWDHYSDKGVFFRTKAEKESSGALIQVRFKDIIKLKPAPASRQVLSAANRVKSAFAAGSETYLDQLLQISSHGNNQFIKRSVCLAGKFRHYEEIGQQLTIDAKSLHELISTGKISDHGVAPACQPLLLANNLSALSLYSTSPERITTIILDGARFVDEERTNFADIDAAGLPTILVTDLSESACFPLLADTGFTFLHIDSQEVETGPAEQGQSPFFSFRSKSSTYFRYRISCEVCADEDLELLARSIQNLKATQNDQELNTLKISLIVLLNQLAALVAPPEGAERALIIERTAKLVSGFEQCRIWLGPNELPLSTCIELLQKLTSRLFTETPEKHDRLKKMLTAGHYDYIICRTQQEVPTIRTLLQSLRLAQQPGVIIAEEITSCPPETKPRRVLVTGWLKIKAMERLFSCFLFSEIDLLFYTFEHSYYKALYRRLRLNEQSVSLPRRPGAAAEKTEVTVATDATDEALFELELQEDKLRFSRYTSVLDREETLPAMRLMLGSGYFMYGSDSHKFLVVTAETGKIQLHYRKTDQLRRGDRIALVTTDSDILARIVDKNTDNTELTEIKYWAGLWKSLLKNYYTEQGSDFRKLVAGLRRNDCIRHEATIRSWLFDDTRIGPDDNSDLISIALLTGSELLLEKISQVRKCISLMTGWRMKAADKLRQQLLDRLTLQYMQTGFIPDARTPISGLGSLQVLTVMELTHIFEDTDLRYVNKLIATDTL